MNILFLLDCFPNYGGIERITALLANELTIRGHRVTIYGRRGNAPADAYHFVEGVEIVNVFDIHDSAFFLNCLRSRETDIIINQGCFHFLNPLLRKARGISNIKIISVLHNDPAHATKVSKPLPGTDPRLKAAVKTTLWPIYRGIMHRRFRRGLQQTVRLSDRMVVLSPTYIDSLYRKSGKHIERTSIVAIPNFIHEPESLDITAKEHSIVYVGRVAELQKKVSRLIDIWEVLSVRIPSWHLTIVGDGDALPTCREEADRRHLENIHFTGYKNDVNPYLRKASIIVLVSDHEGFPMSLLEAMSYGCVPVCYNSFNALSDLVTDGKEGHNIQPLDKEAFINSIVRLVENPDNLNVMQQNAYAKSQSFEISRIINKWLNLIEDITANHRTIKH